MSGKAARLVSLDAFRGFTIASMVLVNNPGDWDNIYGPLEHAKWNGWTFTDFIFPFFPNQVNYNHFRDLDLPVDSSSVEIHAMCA